MRLEGCLGTTLPKYSVASQKQNRAKSTLDIQVRALG